MTGEPMDRHEYEAAMQHVRLFINVARKEAFPFDLALVADLQNRAEAIGPFLDPTLYRNKTTALREDREMVEALRNFQTAVEDIERRSRERGTLKQKEGT